MTAVKGVGDLLDSSASTDVLVDAGITSSGTADLFLKAAHVTRTRRDHHVTASIVFTYCVRRHISITNAL